MRVIFRRFLELLVPMAVMSAITTFLYVRTYIPSNRGSVGIVMLFVSLLYMLYHIYLLTGCCEDIEPLEYYFYNIVAYLLFLIVNLVFYDVCDNNTYTWVFSLTKTYSVMNEQVSTRDSVQWFHGMLVAIILLIPVFKKIRFRR